MCSWRRNCTKLYFYVFILIDNWYPSDEIWRNCPTLPSSVKIRWRLRYQVLSLRHELFPSHSDASLNFVMRLQQCRLGQSGQLWQILFVMPKKLRLIWTVSYRQAVSFMKEVAKLKTFKLGLGMVWRSLEYWNFSSSGLLWASWLQTFGFCGNVLRWRWLYWYGHHGDCQKERVKKILMTSMMKNQCWWLQWLWWGLDVGILRAVGMKLIRLRPGHFWSPAPPPRSCLNATHH